MEALGLVCRAGDDHAGAAAPGHRARGGLAGGPPPDLHRHGALQGGRAIRPHRREGATQDVYTRVS